MGKATGFQHDNETGDIKMNAGDTGSFKVHCSRKSGADWPDTARMLYTIKNQQGEILIQRIYRMDDQWGLGDGVVLIEFHNDDTDDWDGGDYSAERRYDLTPIWEGTPSSARCVDALAPGAAKMIEGVPVRTVFQGTLHIDGVNGRI
jgi:hypothetical protein